MAESLSLEGLSTKEEKYQSAIQQITALTSGETNSVANMANCAAALKQFFNHFWIGFYLVDSNDELVLGPFQGPIACTRIKKGKGVCGTAWKEEKTVIVPNVDEFPGHIACASESKSEIVVPIFSQEKKVIGVLDIDADYLNAFDEIDGKYLEQLMQIFSK
ncbi:GAF domain-containing protein [Luteibaculum oceani]|uniref:GAF domain-containing protein n=1 Tax=Luteibaculum oceani TaxID=1294296 RepID=A0A5C6UZW2_9FLAO|nr:GAF domain-containing protein [Luteibaculum oceani]TXC78983.1 GAF domain-containing protein [Luteibaculum oceani]